MGETVLQAEIEQNQDVSQLASHPPQQIQQDIPQQAAFRSMLGKVAAAQVVPACSAAAGRQPQASGQSATGPATGCNPVGPGRALSPFPTPHGMSTSPAAEETVFKRSAEPVRQLKGTMEQSAGWHAPTSGQLKPSLPARHVPVPSSASATAAAADPTPCCPEHSLGRPQMSAEQSAGDATAACNKLKPDPALSTSSCESRPSDRTTAGQAYRVPFPPFLQARLNRTIVPQAHQAPQPLKAFHGSDRSQSSSSALPALPSHPAQLQRPPSRSSGVLAEQLDDVSQLDGTKLAASDSHTALAHGPARRQPNLEVGCSDGQAAGWHDAESHQGLHGSHAAQPQAGASSGKHQPEASLGGLTAHEKLALRWRIGYKR